MGENLSIARPLLDIYAQDSGQTNRNTHKSCGHSSNHYFIYMSQQSGCIGWRAYASIAYGDNMVYPKKKHIERNHRGSPRLHSFYVTNIYPLASSKMEHKSEGVCTICIILHAWRVWAVKQTHLMAEPHRQPTTTTTTKKN